MELNFSRPTKLGMAGSIRKPRVSIEGFVAAYCVVTLCLQLALPFTKILCYGIPLLSLIAVLASGRFTVPANAPPYLVLVIAGVATAPIGTLKGLQDVWLMLMGLAPFFFGYRYKVTWTQAFVTILAVTAISVGINLSGGKLGFEFDAMNSVSTFESSTSFIFGVLAVWALLEKRGGRFLIALLFTFLTLKRIAVLAALIALVVVWMPRRWMDVVLRPIPMIIFNLLFILASVVYAQGGFDDWFVRTLQQSPDQFGMGRQQLFFGPVSQLMARPWDFLVHGVGAGGVYDLVKTYSYLAGNRNLHNDSLKILVEYGGIVWLATFWVLYRHKSFAVRTMMLFTNILWLTDNTLIYHFVIFPTALALQALCENKDEEALAVDKPGVVAAVRGPAVGT